MSAEPLLSILYVAVPVIGIVVATCGGLLALVADPERPLQCAPVFGVAIVVFLGGVALLCWYVEVAMFLGSRIGG